MKDLFIILVICGLCANLLFILGLGIALLFHRAGKRDLTRGRK